MCRQTGNLWIVLLVFALSVGATVAQEVSVCGKIVYSVYLEAQNTIQIALFDTSTRRETFLTDDLSDNGSPQISPSQSKVVFVSNRDGDREIYTIDIDGTNLHQVTNNTNFDAFPKWSPDETRIVYISDTGIGNDIFIINSDGTDNINLTNRVEHESTPVWSPDGQKIAFMSNFQIFTINVDGSNLTQMTNGQDVYADPQWSPDSSKIAFHGRNEEFFYANTDGTGLTQITHEQRDTGLYMWASNDQLVYQIMGEGFFLINLDGTGRTPIQFGLPSDGDSVSVDLSQVAVNQTTCDTALAPHDTPARLTASSNTP